MSTALESVDTVHLSTKQDRACFLVLAPSSPAPLLLQLRTLPLHPRLR